MSELGTFAIALALAAAVWSVVASLVGAFRHRDDFVRSAEGAVFATAIATTVAAVSLLTALATSDFSMEYVAEYTSKGLDLPYKLAAMWAGQGGSLLLWTWISSILAVIIVVQNRRKGWGVAPFAVTTFGVVSGMFAAFVTLLESPFTTLATPVADGQGLNPLLQNPLQIIHPLSLYGGYILYTVPFALTISALVAGPTDGPWLKVVTRWNAYSWVALTLGIVLGARWAYVELGWGGYWGWDPVENASLIPWLTGTALLHTGLRHWKTGRLRVLGFCLVVATFLLCLFGTFLTRSGVISSVHAFGESSLGPVMGGAIFVLLLISGGLIVWRIPMLRAPASDARAHGWVGQRALTILMIAMTAAVLWGTMYPLFLRIIKDQEISVTPEFFRVVCTPLGVAVIAIFALSPLLPSQTVGSRSRTIVIRSAIFAVVFLAVWAMTNWQAWGVAFVMATSVLAMITVVRKLGSRVKAAWTETTDGHVLAAFRASGPYIGHIGLIILLAAVTLNASLQQENRVSVTVGKATTTSGQNIRVVGLNVDEQTDRNSFIATVDILDGSGKVIDTLTTRVDEFADGQNHANVGIITGWAKDIYVVLEQADLQKKTATLVVYTNPTVVWIWLGGAILAIGGVLFVLPKPRTAPPLPTDGVRREDDDESDELEEVSSR